MPQPVMIQTVAARPIAAVRRRAPIRDIAKTWKPALDQVWEFLRRHDGLRTDGHNVFLYHHPRSGDAMDIDFGVQVVRSFEGEGDVRCAETPAGETASAVHVGPYDQLRQTHEAVHAWAAAHSRAFAGQSWEIYGDWNDDPSKLETQVVYLLR
jgi:effector-binding domain-containing protein